MTSLDNYTATLGHKVCHSFKPNCETDLFLHPRFGLIRCIASLDFIEAGQEVGNLSESGSQIKKQNVPPNHFSFRQFSTILSCCDKSKSCFYFPKPLFIFFLDSHKLRLQLVQLADVVQGGLGQAPEGRPRPPGLEDGSQAEQHEPGQQAVLLALGLQR